MDRPRSHRDTEITRINVITEHVIGAAIEVHRVLGPGLLEGIYETALCIELDERGIKYARQVQIPAHYKGRPLGKYNVDLIIEDLVVVEVKSVAHVLPVFRGATHHLLAFDSEARRTDHQLQHQAAERWRRRPPGALTRAPHDAAKRRAGRKDRQKNTNIIVLTRL
jgi:GxxExxY protein